MCVGYFNLIGHVVYCEGFTQDIIRHLVHAHLAVHPLKMEQGKLRVFGSALRQRPIDRYILICCHPDISVVSVYKVQVFQLILPGCTFSSQFLIDSLSEKLAVRILGIIIFNDIVKQ